MLDTEIFHPEDIDMLAHIASISEGGSSPVTYSNLETQGRYIIEILEGIPREIHPKMGIYNFVHIQGEDNTNYVGFDIERNALGYPIIGKSSSH